MKKVECKVKTAQYIKILSQLLPLCLEEYGLQKAYIIFQQNNGPKHTPNLTRKWFESQHYKVIKWPPHFLDLYQIEYL